MKSVVKLNPFFFPWELEPAVADFVVYDYTPRYHASLHTLTPEAVFLGPTQAGLTQRDRIQPQTLHQRRLTHQHGTMHAVNLEGVSFSFALLLSH